MDIRKLIEEAHQTAVEHGWWSGKESRDELMAKLPAQFMNLSSEVAEAWECFRDGDFELRLGEGGKPEGMIAELADVFIRGFDLVGAIQAEDEFLMAIKVKMEFNRTRPYRHGGKLA